VYVAKNAVLNKYPQHFSRVEIPKSDISASGQQMSLRVT